jgi:hypothetical protein
VILTEVEKQGVKVGIGRLERLVAVQGFGRPVAHKGLQYERNFLSGSSANSFTPDTAEIV